MTTSFKIVLPSYAFTVDKSALRKTLRTAGAEVAAVARSLIRKSAKSAPGQPPVSRTGNLASHIVVRVSKDGSTAIIKDTAEAARGSHAPYAIFLESGAYGGGRNAGASKFKRSHKAQSAAARAAAAAGRGEKRIMLPRPFLSVAIGQRQSTIAERIQAAVVDGIKFQRVKP